MSIGKQAGKGFVSFLFRSVLEKVMGLIAMIFLARKLTPYDFGLVSITEVLLYSISVFGTTGLAEFLLAYRKEDTKEVFTAAFWFNIVITIVVLAVFLAFIPLWAYYQRDERIANIGLMAGGIFICSQLQTIPKTWLSKNLMFDKQVKIQAPFILLMPIGKIIAVFAGLGVYSLLLPTLILQPILTVLLYQQTGISISVKIYRNRWREIYHFTKHLIGANIFTRITDQGDKFILGKFLGLDKLGIYNLAYQLSELFTSQMVQVSNNVLSSVLPKYADDQSKLYNYYISFLRVFSFLTFPLLALMFICAEPLILTLYGPKWVEAVLPLRIFTVVAAFKAVSSSYGCVMNTLHLNKKTFIVTAIYAPVHLAASVIGSFFGIVGIATAVSLVKLIFINWNIKQVMQAMSKPLVSWYRQLLPFFSASTLFSIIVVLFIYLLQVKVTPIVQIGISATLFLTCYILCFRVILKDDTRSIGDFLSKAFPQSIKYFNLVFKV